MTQEQQARLNQIDQMLKRLGEWIDWYKLIKSRKGQ